MEGGVSWVYDTIRYNFTSSKRRNYNRLMYHKVIDFAFFQDISFRKIVSYWDLSDLATS